MSGVLRDAASTIFFSFFSSMALPLPWLGLSLPCHSGLNHRRTAEQLDVLQEKVFSPLPNHHSGGLGFTWVYLLLVSPYLCPHRLQGGLVIPRHWIPVLVASFDKHGVSWGYSESRPPLGKRVQTEVWNVIKYTGLKIIRKLLPQKALDEQCQNSQTLPYFFSSWKCTVMNENKVIQFYPGSSTVGVGAQGEVASWGAAFLYK
jgi:hypothetical protein